MGREGDGREGKWREGKGKEMDGKRRWWNGSEGKRKVRKWMGREGDGWEEKVMEGKWREGLRNKCISVWFWHLNDEYF